MNKAEAIQTADDIIHEYVNALLTANKNYREALKKLTNTCPNEFWLDVHTYMLAKAQLEIRKITE